MYEKNERASFIMVIAACGAKSVEKIIEKLLLLRVQVRNCWFRKGRPRPFVNLGQKKYYSL